MKKFICIILFASLHLFCRAQNVFDTEIPPDMEGSNSSLSSDSIPESNVPHFRHTWQWERNGVYKREIALDTLMDGIQNFNTIFKKRTGNYHYHFGLYLCERNNQKTQLMVSGQGDGKGKESGLYQAVNWFNNLVESLEKKYNATLKQN